MAATEEEVEQKTINEEYKIWKKNSPFLYDLILSSALEWPSLTVQWLPDKKTVKDETLDYSIQRLILGTHTNDNEPNYLMIAEVRLPIPDIKSLQLKYEDSCDVYGGFGGAAGKIEIIHRITHDGEVNRARYMPQNPDIIATKTNAGPVYIFDRTRHCLKPIKGAKCKPNMILHGHTKEGYGLAWNLYDEGVLISGNFDNLICLWDIRHSIFDNSSNNNNNANNKQWLKSTETIIAKPRDVFKSHTSRVEDICWQHERNNVFGSVSDDKTIRLWDIKSSNIKPQITVKEAHKDDINCISFSPYNPYLFVTGGSDKIVALWDTRNTSQKLHSLEGHTGSIHQVAWCPQSEIHLASCSSDRRVMIWDLSQIGVEQSSEDAEDGPPELLFVHGGHTDKVIDFSWNLNDPWVIASVADNNIVQCWQMTDELLTNDDIA